jgi:hypothetical protein
MTISRRSRVASLLVKDLSLPQLRQLGLHERTSRDAIRSGIRYAETPLATFCSGDCNAIASETQRAWGARPLATLT